MDIVISEFMDDMAVEALRRRFAVHYDPALAGERQELLALLDAAPALIVRNRTQVDAALLEAAPRLRVVGRLGVGLDNIDRSAAAEKVIAVSNIHV